MSDLIPSYPITEFRKLKSSYNTAKSLYREGILNEGNNYFNLHFQREGS